MARGFNPRILTGAASLGCMMLIGLSSGVAYAQELPPKAPIPACDDHAAAESAAACGLRVIKHAEFAEVIWVSDESPTRGWTLWINGESLGEQPGAARGVYVDPKRVNPGSTIAIQGHFAKADSPILEVTLDESTIEVKDDPAPTPTSEAQPEEPAAPAQPKVVDTLVIEPDTAPVDGDEVDDDSDIIPISDVEAHDNSKGFQLEDSDIKTLKKLGIPLVASIIGLMIIFIVFLNFLKHRRNRISYDNHPILHTKSPREIKQRLESGVYDLDDKGQPLVRTDSPMMSTPHRELLDAEDFDPYKALELMTGKDPHSVEKRSQGPLLELLRSKDKK